MENIKFTTPNGYVATLKPFITYGQYMQIQKAMISGVKIDTSTGKTTDMDTSTIFAGDDMAISFILVSITDPQGAEFTKGIDELPSKDGIAIKAQIDLITGDASPDKKKETI